MLIIHISIFKKFWSMISKSRIYLNLLSIGQRSTLIGKPKIEARKTENQWLTVFEGVARGRVIGGNLNTIEGIWGSKYMPAIKDGDILFIEDSLKDIATIERSFSLLKVNVVFEKISGIILGKHELFDDLQTGRRPYEVLLEVLGDRKLPFIADFDCCHTHQC